MDPSSDLSVYQDQPLIWRLLAPSGPSRRVGVGCVGGAPGAGPAGVEAEAEAWEKADVPETAGSGTVGVEAEAEAWEKAAVPETARPTTLGAATPKAATPALSIWSATELRRAIRLAWTLFVTAKLYLKVVTIGTVDP